MMCIDVFIGMLKFICKMQTSQVECLQNAKHDPIKANMTQLIGPNNPPQVESMARRVLSWRLELNQQWSLGNSCLGALIDFHLDF